MNASLLGLGGWTIDQLHFYDANSGRIFLGIGTSRAVSGISTGNGGYYVSSNDGSEVYFFDSAGHHLTTNYGLTGLAKYTFAYDSAGRLVSITDAFSNVTTVNRSGGAVTGIAGPYGQTTAITLDTNGYIASIQNPNNEAYYVTSTPSGLISTFHKPLLQTATLSYDVNGYLTKDSSSAGNSTTLNYTPSDATDWTMKTVSALSRTNSYSLTSNLNGSYIRRTTKASSDTEYESLSPAVSYGYSSPNFNTSDSLQNDVRFGAMSPFSYHSVSSLPGSSPQKFSDVTRSVVYNHPSTPQIFDIASLTNTYSQNSKATSTVYNGATKQFTTTTPVGRHFYRTIDSYERPTSTQFANLNPANFTYDTNGRLYQVSQGTRTATLGYNTSGFLSSVTNSLNQSTNYGYDLAGRVNQVTLSDARVIGYVYDSNGNLTSITPPGTTAHAFQFNAFDLSSQYNPPLIGTTSTNIVYSYNNDKQLTKVQKPDGNSLILTYGSSTGLLSQIALPAGSYSYSYASGLLSQATSPDAIQDSVTFAGPYVKTDMLIVPTSSSSLGGITFARDKDFQLSSETVQGFLSSNTSAVNFTYDNDGILSAVGGETRTLSPATGQPSATAIGSNTEAFGYDGYGALTSYAVNQGSTNLYNSLLTRDAIGRISTKSETIGGTTTNYGYTYDAAGRLTDIMVNGVGGNHYNYDSNSNRTSGTIGGSSASAAYDSQDRLLTYNSNTYVYDLNGQLATRSIGPTTNNFTYDTIGNLKSITIPAGTVNYQYDGLGRRSVKLLGTAVFQRFVYRNQTQIAAVLNAAGAITQRFVYGSKNTPDYMVIGLITYRFVPDQTGSIRLVVNTADGTIAERIDYDEFGNVTNDTNPGFQPFGFAGGLYDQNTKLVHFGARDYDPSTGRWISKDPILFGGGDTNLYGYVLNDPINFMDPTGHQPAPFNGIPFPDYNAAPAEEVPSAPADQGPIDPPDFDLVRCINSGGTGRGCNPSPGHSSPQWNPPGTCTPSNPSGAPPAVVPQLHPQ